jgi:hypothetical protein
MGAIIQFLILMVLGFVLMGVFVADAFLSIPKEFLTWPLWCQISGVVIVIGGLGSAFD